MIHLGYELIFSKIFENIKVDVIDLESINKCFLFDIFKNGINIYTDFQYIDKINYLIKSAQDNYDDIKYTREKYYNNMIERLKGNKYG
ncbi:MAG: hypothetical protein RSC92_01560 [Clostridia bacterium]